MNETGTLGPSISVRKVPVSRRVLVVGGGIAGVESALNLASLSCEVTLVERGGSLGGNAAGLFSLYGCAEDPARLIERRTAAARRNPRIDVLLSADVVGVEGGVGNFRVTMERAGEVTEGDFGAIIVATGFELDIALPRADFHPSAVSYLELEKRLTGLEAGGRAGGGTPSGIPKNVCFVVEDSGEESALYSAYAMKNALTIRRLSKSNVFVCCQNVNVASEGLERLYREARAHGVLVFKFDDEKPQISATDTGFSVTVRDNFAGTNGRWNGLLEINCDLLVSPDRIIPRSGAQALREILQVNADPSGYFQEDNVWLKPTASNRRGIFFVGGCRGSFDVGEILTEARSTALEVYNSIGRGEALVTAGRVVVETSKCALCLTCVRSCPHGAVEVVFDNVRDGKAPRIVDIACHACGICAAQCPAKAIRVVAEHDAEEQLLAIG